MEQISEIFARGIGPALFCIGASIFLVLMETTSGYIDAAKAQYTEDESYSQKHTDSDDWSGEIDSVELQSIALTGFTQDSQIVARFSGASYLIELDKYKDYCIVTVFENGNRILDRKKVTDMNDFEIEMDGTPIRFLDFIKMSSKWKVSQEEGKLISQQVIYDGSEHYITKYEAE